MSIYAQKEDGRPARTIPPIYQFHSPPAEVVPPRPSTPERIRERQVPTVSAPYAQTPRDEDFYVHDPITGNVKPNLELLKDHFFHEGRLTEPQAMFILEQAIALMSTEPNLLRISGPATVVGDIHGQYYDLMKVLDVGGKFTENNYLFLGDYVDRGCFGIECLLYVYSLKLWYPNIVFLLRGNHECRHLTGYFTFKRECLHKYSESIYDTCIRSFQALPVTALIDGKFFCVHGGISPELAYLSDLDTMDRFMEPASKGLLCDLLWADPIEEYGHEGDLSPHNPQGVLPPPFLPNTTRGCSYYFTYQAATEFLKRNNLLGIIRGHEAQDHGYMMYRKTAGKQFPSLITIFSAPNYLDIYHNKGAVIKYKNKSITIRQYNSTTHPYWLPNFMDAFTWSLPFVASKILEMLLGVLAVCSEEELEASDEDLPGQMGAGIVPPAERAARRQEIKNKIMAVGKMQRLYALLREEAEGASELMPEAHMPPEADAAAPPGSWPGGFSTPNDGLGTHAMDIRRKIRSFDDARHADSNNERLPQFTPSQISIVPAPSMWVPRLAAANGEGELDPANMSMESYIRRLLEEEVDGETAEKLAERISGKIGERPKALKRFETT